MKQLYATGPIAHLEFSNVSVPSTDTPLPGRTLQLPTVRATSTGLDQYQIHAALPMASYAVSARNEGDDRVLPVRLALLQTSMGRVLTHITPHKGHYFAHSLINVPETADAQLAIQTWGSPLWQKQDFATGSDLPEMPYLPVADVLDDAALKTWLEIPYKRELLEFAITALLGTPKTTRIFLMAPAEDVARVIYAITRALPASLLEDFTFSTYEADPLSCRARLIGHDSGSSEQDFPASCYIGEAVALNTATGKRSDLQAIVPFAEFATTALADGELSALDDLKSTWQRLGLNHAQHLDLIYRLGRGTGIMTKAEAAESLQSPPLAAWISARADVLKQFLDWALDDRSFANNSFSRAVMTLRQKPEILSKVTQSVREAGLQALKDGDKNRTANALEVILPMTAPSKANVIWGELLTQITDPEKLPWEMRWYLLPKFVRFKQQQNPEAGQSVDPAFTNWLDIPAERLSELLQLELPKAYHIAAMRTCLAQAEEPSETFVRTLSQNPALALTILQPTEPTTADKAVTLFEALQTSQPNVAWFEQVVARDQDYPRPLLNRFFESTLNSGQADADRLVRSQGSRILELFHGESALDKLGTLFLAVPPADALNNRTVLDFLNQLAAEPQLSEELKTRIQAIQNVRAYLDQPEFTVEAMKPVSAALAIQPTALPNSAKSELFDAVNAELLKRSHVEELQQNLEMAMLHLGPCLANDATDFYENSLRAIRLRQPEFGKQTHLVHCFLAVALGATQDSELEEVCAGLDGHAFAIASDAAKRGGRKMLDQLDARSKNWPKEVQTKWGFLLAAVRPHSRWQRDSVCLVLGAAVASLAWWISSW